MDKREIAANMILKSIQSFIEAENDFDYIQSILLAGASLGLTEPLLKQKGTQTASEKSADTIIAMREAHIYWEGNKLIVDKSVRSLCRKDRDKIRTDVRRTDLEIYNSLKHTGKFWDNTLAFDDLNIDTDFRATAEAVIFDAIDDFNTLEFDERFEYHSLPENIRILLNCGDPMGSLPKFRAAERKHS
ncbi:MULTISPECIES: hypothetical protein [Photobacterium]|uniref:AbiV family abortive infection protein n=1 Tax=Photobacterium iliopiscarium TaxID=56192 RepID=A0A2T3MF58_9GAMM|nr:MULTISPECIES: hypothetical protein [Photobacterium]MCD9498284.1 hypothetical protein [Photobacterium carnosum]PSV92431.1 hypothetical protein C9I88_16410 [Photobacterium iliopiscarium]